jgi:hypothetical protein
MKLLLEIELDESGIEFSPVESSIALGELFKAMKEYHVKIKQFSLEF